MQGVGAPDCVHRVKHEVYLTYFYAKYTKAIYLILKILFDPYGTILPSKRTFTLNAGAEDLYRGKYLLNHKKATFSRWRPMLNTQMTKSLPFTTTHTFVVL